ncbi:MAG TPA: hypothetical protein VK927_06110 [Adhaeribacter sp.]|nr:hypothetical protein [Adhaeribacter sp.]
MNTTRELQSVGGQGYTLCPEKGKYEVRFSNGGIKTFNKLSHAVKFYEYLDEESALWSFTSTTKPELLDVKQYN